MSRSANISPIARAKLDAMPFGPAPPFDITFDLRDVFDDRRWMMLPSGWPGSQQVLACSARQIGNALRFYWTNKRQTYQLRRRAAIESAIQKYGRPLLEVLSVEAERQGSSLHETIVPAEADGHDHIHALHVALQGLRPVMEPLSPGRRRVLGTARKSAGKLSDPAGYRLAYSLIDPYITLSGRRPSGNANSRFAQFIEAVHAAYLRRLAFYLRQTRPDLSEAAVNRTLERHSLRGNDAARWAVDQWKSGQGAQ